MRSLTVLVKLNEVTTAPKVIAPWELPVLEGAITGATSSVTVHEKGVAPDVVPDAEAEYKRLETVYGSDDDTKVSHVAFAYGVGHAGVRSLARAIDDALNDSSDEPEEEEEAEDNDGDAGDGDQSNKPAKKSAKKRAKKRPAKPKPSG